MIGQNVLKTSDISLTNLSSSPVSSPEAVKVRSTAGDIPLHLSGVPDHSNSLIGVKVGLSVLRGESEQRPFGIVDSALSYQPPGRLGSEPDTDEEGDGPHPLQGVW